jgi:hypothetical protein
VVLKNYTRSCIGHVILHGFFRHPVRGGHWRKWTNGREGSWCRNYDVASGQLLKLVMFSQKKAKSLIFLSRHSKNVKNQPSLDLKYCTDSIVKPFSKNCSSKKEFSDVFNRCLFLALANSSICLCGKPVTGVTFLTTYLPTSPRTVFFLFPWTKWRCKLY